MFGRSKFVFSLFIGLFISHFVHAESADKDSTNWLKTHTLSTQLLAKQPDSALYYAHISLDIAKKNEGFASNRLRKSYLQLAIIYAYIQNKPMVALAYMDTVMTIINQNNAPSKEIAKSLQTQAQCYDLLGRYEKAMERMIKAIQILEKKPIDSQRLGGAYNNLALLYSKNTLKNEGKAIQYLKRAELLLINYPEVVNVKLNLAAELAKGKMYEEALQLFRALLNQLLANGNISSAATVENNIGSLFIAIDEYDSARTHLSRAINYFKQVNNPISQANALMLLARAYNAEGFSKTAIRFYKQALSLHDSSLWEMNIDLYKVGAEIYKKYGNLADANRYLLLMTTAKDSVFAQESRRQAEMMHENYELEKRDQEIEALQNEKTKREQQRNQALLGIACIVLLSVAGFALLRDRQKLKLQQAELNYSIALNQQQESDRKQLATELHDGVAQDLTILRQSLFATGNHELALQADKSIETLRNTSRFLYPASLASTGLQSALNHLLNQWQAITPIFLAYEFNYPSNWIPLESEIHIYRFVQEAVNNAIKHASPQAISITMLQQNGHLTVRVQDNGSGFNSQLALQNPKSFGLLSLKHRANQLSAIFQISSVEGKGSIVTLQIPKRLHEYNHRG